MINIISQIRKTSVKSCLQAVALLVVILIFLKSIIDVDKAWDTWNYHLPLAARIWGIVTAQFYTFEAGIEYRFNGYPLFVEFLQGLFWLISQRLQSANLVSFLSLVLYFYFLIKIFTVGSKNDVKG